MSWKQAKLSDIADVQVGFAFPSKDFLDADKAGIFLLRGDNLQQGYIRWGDKTKKWTDIEDKKLERYFLQKHDVVLAMDRPIVSGGLKISKILDQDLPSYLVQRVMRLRGLCDIDTSYIFHLLRSNNFIGYIERITTGANIPHISHKEVVEYTFQLPPISIRKKIASILSNYDDLIQTNQQRIALLEEAAQRLYDEWFVKLRFPNHEQVPVVDGVPEGWERVTLSKLVDLINGYPFKPSELGEEGYPIIKIPELRSGILATTPRNDGSQIPTKYFVNHGDIIFSWSGTILIDEWGYDKAILNQHLFNVVPYQKERKSFIRLAIQQAIPEMVGHAIGSTMMHLRRGTVDNYQLLLPSEMLLSKFCMMVDNIFYQSSILKKQNQKLAQARDALLPRLMSGKMDVSGLRLKEIA